MKNKFRFILVLMVLMISLISSFVFAEDSTNPDDYFFYDDMETAGSFSTFYTTAGDLSYSTTFAKNGTHSLKLTEESNYNNIGQEYVTPSVFKNINEPFCMDFYFLESAHAATNSEFLGISFGKNGTKWAPELNTAQNGYTSAAGQGIMSPMWTPLYTVSVQTWNYQKYCFNDGYASSGTTTFTLYDTPTNVVTSYTVDRINIQRMFFTNYGAGQSARIEYYDNFRIWDKTEYGIYPPEEKEAPLENEAPVIDASAFLPVENASTYENWIYYDYNASDPNGDSLTYSVTLFFNGVYNNSYATDSGNITVLTPGNYSLILNVSDTEFTTTSSTTWIYKNNNAPVIDAYVVLPVENASTYENWIYYDYNVSDAESHSLTYNVSLYLDGVYNISYTSDSVNVSVGTPGNYTLIMNVTDGYDTTTKTSWVYKNNNPPTIDAYVILPVENASTYEKYLYFDYNASDSEGHLISYNASLFIDGIYSTSYLTDSGNITIETPANYTLIMNVSDGYDVTSRTSWVNRQNHAPVIDSYAILPNESIYYNGDSIYYDYNASDSDGETLNYTFNVFLDGAFNTSYNADSGNISLTGQGNYTFIMNVSDGYDVTTSGISWLFRDTINPVLNIYNPSDANTSEYYNLTIVPLNFSVVDDNLYGWNITCYNQNGSVAYSNESLNLAVTTYNFYDEHLFNGEAGTKTCSVVVADTHTAQEINFETKVKRSFLGFGEDKIQINGGEVEIVYPKNNVQKLKQLGYEKKKDRISPIIETDINESSEYTEIEYIVRYNGRVDYIESEYKGHIVILPDGDLRQGYWHDLENEVDAEIIETKEVVYADKKEIQYKLRIKNSNYKGVLQTNSVGGLNIVERNFTFETLGAQYVTINNTEIWNNDSALVNITVYNDTNTTTHENVDITTLLMPCNQYTMKINSTLYVDEYFVSQSNCGFDGNYTYNEWYQATLSVNTINNQTAEFIDNTIVTVTNGTVSRNYTITSTNKTIYVNAEEYNLSTTLYGYESLNNESVDLDVGDLESVTLYLDKIIYVQILVLDVEKETWTPGLNATVDIYNEKTTDSASDTFENGASAILQLKEGVNRINVYADGYNSNLLYYEFDAIQQYNLTIYLSNATSTGIKDVIVQVRDDGNQLLEAVDVRVYAQNGSTFTLISSPTTNINGETVVQTTLESVFYKFTLYYEEVKCYETTNAFTINANDDYLYLTCILAGNYIEERDIYNEVTTSVAHVNTTPLLGYFTMEGESTINTEYCLYVYDDTNGQVLVDSNCNTGNIALINLNVDASNELKDVTYRAVATYRPDGVGDYRVAGFDYISFDIESEPDYGSWGIFLVLIAIVIIIIVLFEQLTLIPMGIGAVYFIATWMKIIDIPMLSGYAEVGSGVVALMIGILVTYVIGVNKGE
ncbi:MAG: hypothetical protein D4S01_05860 [Dehalococcoidia bacterium]|nr:MAG: hypothetical protein D4S01_05860 [Dehalococcoidia bacterium]